MRAPDISSKRSRIFSLSAKQYMKTEDMLSSSALVQPTADGLQSAKALKGSTRIVCALSGTSTAHQTFHSSCKSLLFSGPESSRAGRPA